MYIEILFEKYKTIFINFMFLFKKTIELWIYSQIHNMKYRFWMIFMYMYSNKQFEFCKKKTTGLYIVIQNKAITCI